MSERQNQGLTVTTLFHHWEALQERLRDSGLHDQDSDRMVDQCSRTLIRLAGIPSADLGEVFLKLEICAREMEAGASEAIDALLKSALRDRTALLAARPVQPVRFYDAKTRLEDGTG